MKGIASQFVLLVFLLVLMWSGLSSVFQNMQYGCARDYHRFVIRQIENSDFDADVIRSCKREAQKRGYQLEIRQYGEDRRDARVTMDFWFRFPVTQHTKKYRMDGYAR